MKNNIKFTDSEINERLISSFTKVLVQMLSSPPDTKIEIDLNTEIESLMLDSLDEVEIVMNLENEFEINIDDYDAEKIMKDNLHIYDLKRILKEKYNIFDIKEDRKLKIINISNNIN